jgi:hypothetical protein
MEAYQNLGTSIDLECCSEIDVAITNADVRPGTIALAIRLTDSDSIGKPSQDLEERIIVSSKAALISLNRPPVEEVLRFPSHAPRQFIGLMKSPSFLSPSKNVHALAQRSPFKALLLSQNSDL